jgi:hypothetical protein
LHFNPVYGGGPGPTKPKDEFFWIDDLYLSGR